MGRDEHRHAKGKKKHKLPQTPKNQKTDGIDVEFSEELADHEDMQALKRSKAADRRANLRKQ
ncbi:YfhD family protein [Halobacillus sp. BBL2006]|uniref:YfhD family protein n=1 Tax=Halobacillus sp. BBL2006 TaxID=1543706 RepID=UPI00054336F4|nr:YfhD family protein [Halobacillus sp. BBL2006]KHE73092.1 hypothetical protein LD39_01115 [Halobacillus sp. BBL2006]